MFLVASWAVEKVVEKPVEKAVELYVENYPSILVRGMVVRWSDRWGSFGARF